MLVGQLNLIKKLQSFSIDTFPRSVLICGEKGMGKHTIVDYIHDNILNNITLIDITDNISESLIDEIYRNPNPAIYLIDLSDMTEKNQNIILKFVEEPLNNSFIILLCENTNMVLNTVCNRCVVFELDKYSDSELMNFITSETDIDLILDVIRSPGKIKSTNIANIKEMYDIANKIIYKLSYASLPNTLSISEKINFKDNYGKFELDIFLDILCNRCLKEYIRTLNDDILDIYVKTQECRKRLIDKRINKELLFENFLINLWAERKFIGD